MITSFSESTLVSMKLTKSMVKTSSINARNICHTEEGALPVDSPLIKRIRVMDVGMLSIIRGIFPLSRWEYMVI